MLTGPVIVVASFVYVGLLFAIAYFGDKRADAGRSIIANPYIYALSLAVYSLLHVMDLLRQRRARHHQRRRFSADLPRADADGGPVVACHAG